jgi:hypothetical protein
MGESSAATVKEIEDIRGRLESNFVELERRMPAPAIWGKRAAGIAIGTGMSAIILRQILKRGGKRISPSEDHVAAEVMPQRSGSGWTKLALVGAGALLVFQVIELRKLNRALLTRGE